jgi:hypothetical protein
MHVGQRWFTWKYMTSTLLESNLSLPASVVPFSVAPPAGIGWGDGTADGAAGWETDWETLCAAGVFVPGGEPAQPEIRITAKIQNITFNLLNIFFMFTTNPVV